MKAVILQPSYIPWRGYFDQIRRADLFVFYDDVQYDKHGWRNRNQIKTSQGKKWLTIPVHSKGATAGLLANQVRIDWSRPWPSEHLKALTFAYRKAPHFEEYHEWLTAAYARHDALLVDFTTWFTVEIARKLGLVQTGFVRSSELTGISGTKTERLIQILKRVGASHYISGPSAADYLELDLFASAGITIEFMRYVYADYPQLHPPFEPNVSILDLMFMVGNDANRYLLEKPSP